MIKLKIFSLVVISILAGCVATTGGLQLRGNGLPDNYADIASELVGVARQTCIKVSGNSDKSRDDWNKGRKLDVNDWIVRRFYTSNTPWVKVEAVTQGIIDDIYFQTQTKRLVCGANSWGKLEDNSSIRFTEYGTKPSVDSVASPKPSATHSANTAVTKDTAYKSTISSGLADKRVLAVRWEGYSSLMVGEAVIQQNKSLVTLSVQLPNNEGTCTGVSQLTHSSNGIWTISCTNNLSAAGTFVANGTGKGSSGSGKDGNGRIVDFTMGGSN